MEKLEKKANKKKNITELYNDIFKQKFKSLNNENISQKNWHNSLQKMCSYKKNKQLLDTLNGPVAPYIKLNR